MIREIKEADIDGLNNLPPDDWGLDYSAFLRDFGKEDYFHAFVIIEDEKIVGTGNVFLKGTIGWLANIIIIDEYRGRGLGKKMTEHLVNFLVENGSETQLLIATELGESVYTKIGFKKLTIYRCFDSEINTEISIHQSIKKLTATNIDEVFELDKKANDEDRFHLLKRFLKNGYGYFNPEGKLQGFYLPSFSRGLVIAKDKTAGLELLKLKHSKKGQRSLLPVENIEGINYFEKIGFKEGEQCSRMIYGKENNWNPEFVFSYGSGYCG